MICNFDTIKKIIIFENDYLRKINMRNIKNVKMQNNIYIYICDINKLKYNIHGIYICTIKIYILNIY